jgi:hypothetical protein
VTDNQDIRPKGYTPHHERLEKVCEDCKFFKWIGSGSRNQQSTMCTKVTPNFVVYLEDICDEYEQYE